MADLKKKYKRSIIKLGNSKAITFPQEWTNDANLAEKSEVTLYPIDERTIVVRAFERGEQKTQFTIDGKIWPIKLIKQAIISAFKLNVDEIFLKYDEDNQEDLYELLVDLRREIIGLDFKSIEDDQFYINFLLDSKKTDVPEVLYDLANVFNTIIKQVLEGNVRENNKMLLAEIDRKYSLGTRILITGLSEYPVSRGYQNMPIIRFLGDRVVLLYIRDFINNAFMLQYHSQKLISKYSDLLERIPKLLKNLIKNYDNINFDTISEFQEYLLKLNQMLQDIDFDQGSTEEQEVRSLIKYFLNSFQNFFDIGITRLIESKIGMAK